MPSRSWRRGLSHRQASECVEALVDPENVASRRVLDGNGFIRESGLRSWIDTAGESEELLIYSRSRTGSA